MYISVEREVSLQNDPLEAVITMFIFGRGGVEGVYLQL